MVFFEGLEVRAIVIFARETLCDVCAVLKKKHPNQDKVLLFTQANFNQLLAYPEHFEALGVKSFIPGERV
ncbi:MAG: hypothetical protein WD971_11445 [Pirellulales bacterium]